MKKKFNRKSKLFLILIIISVIALGYSLISTTLNINGTASIKSNTWNIHYSV